MNVANFAVLHSLGRHANLSYGLWSKLPSLRDGTNIISPLVCTSLEAALSRQSEWDEFAESAEEPEESPIWGDLASSLTARLAEGEQVLTLLWGADYSCRRNEYESDVWKTCQPVPPLRLSFLRNMWALLRGEHDLRPEPMYFIDAAPGDIPDFHLNVAVSLCLPRGETERVKRTLISSSIGALKRTDFTKCRFMVVPCFVGIGFQDGAGLSIFHQQERAHEVKESAKAICRELGLEWRSG